MRVFRVTQLTRRVRFNAPPTPQPPPIQLQCRPCRGSGRLRSGPVELSAPPRGPSVRRAARREAAAGAGQRGVLLAGPSRQPSTSARQPNTSAQHVSTSAQHVSTSPQHVSTSAQHVSPTRQPNTSARQPNTSAQHASTSAQHVSTLPQHVSPTRQHVTPARQPSTVRSEICLL